MSWFEYGTPEKRHWRKGVWLRVRSLKNELLGEAQKFIRPNEIIQWVEIKEIGENDQVLLEFWCQSLGDMAQGITSRFSVFHIWAKESPEWVCEGDLGRGMVEERRERDA